jgi:hypothetical protein
MDLLFGEFSEKQQLVDLKSRTHLFVDEFHTTTTAAAA